MEVGKRLRLAICNGGDEVGTRESHDDQEVGKVDRRRDKGEDDVGQECLCGAHRIGAPGRRERCRQQW